MLSEWPVMDEPPDGAATGLKSEMDLWVERGGFTGLLNDAALDKMPEVELELGQVPRVDAHRPDELQAGNHHRKEDEGKSTSSNPLSSQSGSSMSSCST